MVVHVAGTAVVAETVTVAGTVTTIWGTPHWNP